MQNARTAPDLPGAAAGINEDMIRGLVVRFYARVRKDELLGPIFNGAIDDWDAHLDKLCAFWSSVTLMSGRYKGRPMQVHAALPGIGRLHFERWLALFARTAEESCPPAAAAFFVDRAHQIAASLQRGMSMTQDGLFARTNGPDESQSHQP